LKTRQGTIQPTHEQLIAHAIAKLDRIKVGKAHERFREEARMNQQLLEIAISALTSRKGV